MKTAEQIASEAMDAFSFIDPDLDRDNNDVAEQDFYYIKDQIEAAIEADRAQRAESVDPDIPTALLEAVGADFQDGEALWYFPAEQVPGWFDAVIHHEDSGRIVRYAYEDSTDTVTAHEHGKVVEVR